jgi:hypothetical protein
VTLQTYLDTGLQLFGPQEFARINQILERFRVDVDFLVYGFDPGGVGHVFSVYEGSTGNAPLRIIHRAQEDYAVIGSGAVGVDFDLSRRPLKLLSESELLYRVAPAKFQAERAPGVGHGTIGLLLELGERNVVQEKLISADWAALRRVWNTEGQPPLPEAALRLLTRGISDALSKDKWSERALAFVGAEKNSGEAALMFLGTKKDKF